MIPENQVGSAEFEAMLGLPSGTLDERTRRLLSHARLRYRPVNCAGQARLRAEIAQQISDGFSEVGEHRAGIWRDAWQQQLERFERSNYDLKTLNPSFVASSTILRWQGAYIESVTEQFELVFLEILRDWLFRNFLGDVGHLYEFGSGSAFNVAAYAGLFPQIQITALDWAPAAVRIADLLGEHLGLKINGCKFDFLAPSRDLSLGPASGVLTMCALEQIGDRFKPFLDYVLQQKPLRVVHVEPTLELYDPDSAHDQLAIAYHTQRKYLSGLLPTLTRLAGDGKIQISFKRRLRFGSRFHECFTVIVWEPI